MKEAFEANGLNNHFKIVRYRSTNHGSPHALEFKYPHNIAKRIKKHLVISFEVKTRQVSSFQTLVVFISYFMFTSMFLGVTSILCSQTEERMVLPTQFLLMNDINPTALKCIIVWADS